MLDNRAMAMTFDHLTDGEFEELAYDLLLSLGFSGLSWRRGSGKGGATADQGRDIESQKLEHDVDGHARDRIVVCSVQAL